jgi:hypothetical protein
MSVVNYEGFAVLTGYAKAFTARKGDATLHPRHLAAAAWLAYSKGRLKTAPTLEAHGEAIMALLKAESIGFESIGEPARSPTSTRPRSWPGTISPASASIRSSDR